MSGLRFVKILSLMVMLVCSTIFFILITSSSLLQAEYHLQKALNQAVSGSTLNIPPGTYTGNFIISKPLKVVGSKETVLDGGGNGTVLKVISKNVSIENLTIRNSGSSLGKEDSGIHIENSSNFYMKRVNLYNVLYGIRLLASPRAIIKYCSIKGKKFDVGRRGDGIKIWYSPEAKISNNSVQNVRDILIWYSNNSKFFDNKIKGSRYGLHYMYSHNNFSSGNDIRNNSVGVYDMYSNDLVLTRNTLIGNRGPSGYGFAVKESDRLKITDNIIMGNREGIRVDNSPLQAPRFENEKTIFQNNTISYNDIGVLFVGRGKWNYFYNNDFNENWQHVSSIDSKTLFSEWLGNYWSNYKGWDLNEDGIGDIHYKPISLVDSLMDRKVGFQIFRFSPAMLALQFSERSVPWLIPEPKWIDTKPQLRPYKNIKSKTKFVFSFTLFSVSSILLGLGWILQKKVRI